MSTVSFLLFNPYKFWGAYQESSFLHCRVTRVCLVPPVHKDWSEPRWLFCLSKCLKTSQQPQQLKKDKRGYLKMAKTLLETERRFEPPSYFWGCSSNYDPGKSIQQINLRHRACPSVVEVWWILFLGIRYLSKTHWNTSDALTSTSKSSTHWSCRWNFSGNVLCPVWGRVCLLPRVH